MFGSSLFSPVYFLLKSLSSTIDREQLKPGCSVALHRHSHSIVDTLPPEADSSISLMTMGEKPDVTYSVIFSSLFLYEIHSRGYW